MDIYLVGNRMFMIMDTTDAFDLHQKAAQDNADARVQEWEELMWKYQKPLPFASPDEKWLLMEKIFELR
jgi:L-rhamnose mutarotase